MQTILKLRGCGLGDEHVLVIVEALRSYPAVGKIDLRGNSRIGAHGVRCVIEFVERQIASALKPVSPQRLREDLFVRRLHGVVADTMVRRTCCLRRVKLDSSPWSKADRERLKHLEPLAERANERLAIRDAMLSTCASRQTRSLHLEPKDLVLAATKAVQASAVDPRGVKLMPDHENVEDGLEAFENFVYSKLGDQSLLAPPREEDVALLQEVFAKHRNVEAFQAPPADLEGDRGDMSPLRARAESAFSDDTSHFDESTTAGTYLSAARNGDDEDPEDDTDDEGEESESSLLRKRIARRRQVEEVLSDTPRENDDVDKVVQNEKKKLSVTPASTTEVERPRPTRVASLSTTHEPTSTLGKTITTNESPQDERKIAGATDFARRTRSNREVSTPTVPNEVATAAPPPAPVGDSKAQRHESKKPTSTVGNAVGEPATRRAKKVSNAPPKTVVAAAEPARKSADKTAVTTSKSAVSVTEPALRREQGKAVGKDADKRMATTTTSPRRRDTSLSSPSPDSRRRERKISEVVQSAELPLNQRLAMLDRELPVNARDVDALSDELLGEEDDDVLSPRRSGIHAEESSILDEHPMAMPPFRLTAASLRAANDRSIVLEDTTSEKSARNVFDSLVESRMLQDDNKAITEREELHHKPGRCVDGKLTLSDRAIVGATLLPEIDASMLAYGEQYSFLVNLDISRNRLRWLPFEAFSRLTSLQILDCSQNELKHLAPSVSPPLTDYFSDDETRGGDVTPPSSRRSSVSSRSPRRHQQLWTGRFSSLPDTLVQLDASYNQLDTLRGVEDCAFIRILRVGHNCLKTARGLEHLSELEELDLSHNPIKRQTALRPLSCNLDLRSLRLRGCPINQTPKQPQHNSLSWTAALDLLSSRPETRIDDDTLVRVTSLMKHPPTTPTKTKKRGAARAIVIGLLPQLEILDDEPLPRSARGKMERSRRSPRPETEDENRGTLRLTDSARSQRDADARRYDFGKSLVSGRRAEERNLGGEPLLDARTSSILGSTKSVPSSSSRRRTRDEQTKAMEALMRDCANKPRAKVEPKGPTPRVFGQPWTEPPPPLAKKSKPPPPASPGESETSSPMRKNQSAHYHFRKHLSSTLRKDPTEEPNRELFAARAPHGTFEEWLGDLVRQSNHAEKAVDILEKLHKVRGGDQSYNSKTSVASAPADLELIQPFRETLAKLERLANTSPPESTLEALISAPQQLKLAATTWNRARSLVSRLKELIDPLVREAEDDEATVPQTIATSVDAAQGNFEGGAYPLADFATRLQAVLGRLPKSAPKPSSDEEEDTRPRVNSQISELSTNTSPRPHRVSAAEPSRSSGISLQERYDQQQRQQQARMEIARKDFDDPLADQTASKAHAHHAYSADEKRSEPDPIVLADEILPPVVSRKGLSSVEKASPSVAEESSQAAESEEDEEVQQEEPVSLKLRRRLQMRQLEQLDADEEEDDEKTTASPAWREGYDEKWKKMYYFNDETGESSWVKPAAPYKSYDADESDDDESST